MNVKKTKSSKKIVLKITMSMTVGKSMTKTKGSLRSQRSIIEIHSFNRTVLIDEKKHKEQRGI